MVEFKVLTGTLDAGEETITFTDSNINNNSIIEVYTNDFNVYPESIAQSENQLTISFNASLNPVLIKVLINNIQNTLNTPITKLNELVDVAATLLEDGYILVWDADMNTWVPEELPEGGASTWSEVSNKPFESIGDGLSVDEDGVLSAAGGASTWSEVSNKPFETIGSGLSVQNSELKSNIIYSTEEQIIGEYLGKTLYRKTYQHVSVTMAANTWTNTNVTVPANITIVKGFITILNDSHGGCLCGTLGAHGTTHLLQINSPRDVGGNFDITIDYTKK